MLRLYGAFNFESKPTKSFIFTLFLLCFITNICPSFSVTIKRKTNDQQLIVPIDEYTENQPSTDHKDFPVQSDINDHTHKAKLLYAIKDSNTSTWSDAFNFQKVAGTQIDPRTGTFTAYIKTGSLISNLDHGPDINLQINYNSSSTANPDGLDRGWSWNLTHFNPANNQLATSQGQNFILQQDDAGRWRPRYHKIKDIQIGGEKQTHFFITYINGLREILNHDGYEVRLEQQDGKGVNFSYLPGTHLLSMISDDMGRKIILSRKNNYLTVTSYNSNGKPINIRISSDGKQLQSVILSNHKQGDEQGVYLYYSPVGHLLNQLVYPTGLTKSIHYDCHQAMKMPLLYNNRQQGLCVVTSQVVDPGMAQPKMVTFYTYDQINNNEHNYLGFNAGLNIIPGEQKDFLFEAPATYTYRTSEDNGLLQTIRTYNKYHLLIDIKLFSDKTKHLLAETHNFFCRKDQYDGCAHTSFEDLPVTYTLPLKMETYTWGERSGSPAIDITLQTYDNNGRLIDETDTYGRRKTIKYCPVKGDAFCPVQPSGWSLHALTESVTHYPSDQVAGASALPVTKLYSYYQKEMNINGEGYILVLHKQLFQSGHQQDEIIRQYYNYLDNYATYGLLQKLTLTGKTPVGKKPEKLIRQYHYIVSTDKTTKTSYSILAEGSRQARRSPAVTVSLFTHQTLQTTDAFGKNIIRYHYDDCGRLIRIDSVAGTTFAASKYYHYTVSPQLNQLIVTGVNSLRQKIIFDGAGRELENFSEMINASGKAQYNRWQRISSVTYDANGRLAATHSYDYRKNLFNQPKQLITTYDYTATGRILRKHLPDGEVVVNNYDDPDRCMISYKRNKKGDHSVITVVNSNITDKPIRQILLPESAGLPLSVRQYCTTANYLSGAKITTITYDAYGRKISSTDPAGKTVIIHYNERGRVSEVIDPVGNKTHNVYNFIGKVVEKWLEPAKNYHRYLMFSAQYNAAGELLWQAGEDGKHTTYTYTSDGKPDTITMPAGHIITYKYNLLRLPVSKWLNGKLLLQIHYNPLTAQPDKMVDNTGTKQWTYSDDGKIMQLIHYAVNSVSADYKIAWDYNENRNIRTIIHPFGAKVKVAYDRYGRISSVNYQINNAKKQLLYTPIYDGFSRIVRIKYGSGMQRSIEYNSYGQKRNVTDMLSGEQLSAWQYHYDNVGDITTLVHRANDHQQAVLNYRYDKLNNLISVICTGSAGLPLCPRDTHFKGSYLNKAPVITRQDYTFNALNRMTQVKEILTDATQQKTLSKVVNYSYGNIHAPLRLQQISTKWNNQPAVIRHFNYDIAGNMITDSENNHLTYNAFNQITQIITSDGKQSEYIYDGNGREVKQITANHDIRYMFYIGKKRVGEQVNDLQHNRHMITPLGIAKAIDGVIHEYYEQNYKRDTTGILIKSDDSDSHWIVSQHIIYSPYGMQWHNHTNTSQLLYLRTLVGFDGEQHDPVTGWQFLGAGHRTYNPGEKYFVSEDPAGDGYAFAGNNPIVYTDPGGNRPEWVSSAIQIMGYAGSLGMFALHKKWANIVGTTVIATLSTIVIGAGLIAGNAASLVTGGGICLSAAAGGVMVAAAAIPTNRGLNIAGTIAGITQMAVSVASSGLGLAIGVCTCTKWFKQAFSFYLDFSAMLISEGEEAVMGITVPEAVIPVSRLSATAEKLMKLFPENIQNRGETAMFSIGAPDQFASILRTVVDNFQSISRKTTDTIFSMLAYMTQTKRAISLNKLSEFLQFASYDESLTTTSFDQLSGGIKQYSVPFREMQAVGHCLIFQGDYDLMGTLVRSGYIVYNPDNAKWSATFLEREYSFFAVREPHMDVIVSKQFNIPGDIFRWFTLDEESVFGFAFL